MKRLVVRIKGRVQGVFFRQSASEMADSLGLSGFVKNEKDGSVYIEAQGETNELNLFLSWCGQGPKASKVESLIHSEIETRNEEGFQIVR